MDQANTIYWRRRRGQELNNRKERGVQLIIQRMKLNNKSKSELKSHERDGPESCSKVHSNNEREKSTFRDLPR